MFLFLMLSSTLLNFLAVFPRPYRVDAVLSLVISLDHISRSSLSCLWQHLNASSAFALSNAQIKRSTYLHHGCWLGKLVLWRGWRRPWRNNTSGKRERYLLLQVLVRHPGESVGKIGKRNPWTCDLGIPGSEEEEWMIMRRTDDWNPSQTVVPKMEKKQTKKSKIKNTLKNMKPWEPWIFMALSAVGCSILTEIPVVFRDSHRTMTKNRWKFTLWMKLNWYKTEKIFHCNFSLVNDRKISHSPGTRWQ